jgi:hypothetical protein
VLHAIPLVERTLFAIAIGIRIYQEWKTIPDQGLTVLADRQADYQSNRKISTTTTIEKSRRLSKPDKVFQRIGEK